MFIAFTVIVFLLTFLPLSNHAHWLVRGLDFPRLQLAFLAGVLLAAQLLFLNLQLGTSWVLLGITAACLSYQLWWVLPYTKLWKKEVRRTKSTHNTKNQLRILTANVLTPNRNSQALIELVKKHQPDVLVTLESDSWWQEQLEVLEGFMPYTIKCPLDNLYGMHVYSKLALTETDIAFLVEDGVPSMHALLHLPCSQTVRMHFLHPAPPSPTENEESKERDAELIIVAKSIRDSSQPTIVTGDFNDVAWSKTTTLFRKISKLLDPRVGRGMFNTFHVKFPFLRWPLDHLFHSEHFSLLDIKRLGDIGSDHFPLLTTLVFTPIKGASQESLDADKSDKQAADALANQEKTNKNDVPEPGE